MTDAQIIAAACDRIRYAMAPIPINVTAEELNRIRGCLAQEREGFFADCKRRNGWRSPQVRKSWQNRQDFNTRLIEKLA